MLPAATRASPESRLPNSLLANGPGAQPRDRVRCGSGSARDAEAREGEAMVISRELLMLGNQVGERLRARGDTVGVAESAAGGLVAATLLAVPGASGYFRGGSVVYTAAARSAFLGLPSTLPDLRPDTEPYASLLARTVRERLETTWGIGETGAAGPTGSRYGDPPGHVCVAVSGPVESAATVRTDSADRVPNMEAFAAAALRLLHEALGSS